MGMSIKSFAVFFKMRLLQTCRILREIGALRIIFILLLTVHSFIVLYNIFMSAPWLCCLSTVVLLLVLHIKRGDKVFLDRFLDRGASSIYTLEYIILAFPALILLLIGSHIIYSILLFISIMVLPYIPIKAQLKRKPLRMDFFPKTAFEWKSGFRWSLFLSVILVACGTVWADRTFIPVIVVFLLTIIWSSYNIYCESRLMIEIFPWRPFRYLIHKIGRQFAFSFCLLLPLNMSFLYWNPHYWYILLFVNFICHVVQSLSICFKYAMFVPNKSLRLNLLLLCSAVALFFFPWTAPIPVVVLVIYYIKALNNLKQYLYVGS